MNIKPKQFGRSDGRQNGDDDSHTSSDTSSQSSDHDQGEELRAANGDSSVRPSPPSGVPPTDSRGSSIGQRGAAISAASASPPTATCTGKTNGSVSSADGNGHPPSSSSAGESIKRLPHYVNVKPTQYLRANTSPGELSTVTVRVSRDEDKASNSDHGKDKGLESAGAEARGVAGGFSHERQSQPKGGPRNKTPSPPLENREAREGEKIKRLPHYVNIKPTHYLRADTSPAVLQSGNEAADGVGEGSSRDRQCHTEGGSRDVTPTPSSPPPEDREDRTPTPPLPDRQYADSDIRRTPTPPLPVRHNEGSPSPPPPLPARRYSNQEQMRQVKLRRAQLSEAGSKNGHLTDPNHRRGSDAGTQSQEGVQRMVAMLGDEYALVNKRDAEHHRPVSWAERPHSASYATIPPPLPPYTPESRQESGEPEERRDSADSQTSYSARYVDIDAVADPRRMRSRMDPYRDSIAYAIVTLEDKPVVASEGNTEHRSKTPPEPYEIPVTGGTLPGAGTSSTGGVASNESRGLVPGMSGPPGTYEEIDFSSSSQQSKI